MFYCVIMRDGERKILTVIIVGNVFCNMLSARQTLCVNIVNETAVDRWHWHPYRRPLRDFFDDVDIPNVVIPSSSKLMYDNAKRHMWYVFTNKCPTRQMEVIKLTYRAMFH